MKFPSNISLPHTNYFATGLKDGTLRSSRRSGEGRHMIHCIPYAYTVNKEKLDRSFDYSFRKRKILLLKVYHKSDADKSKMEVCDVSLIL